jgi:hypothetical protein
MAIKEKNDVTKTCKDFLESFLKLHRELVKTKDDIIGSLQEENISLKEALISAQEAYMEDREVMKVLQNQIKLLQNELDFVKKKYQMMWNQAIEKYSSESKKM